MHIIINVAMIFILVESKSFHVVQGRKQTVITVKLLAFFGIFLFHIANLSY